MMEFLLMWLMFHLFVVIRNIVLAWCLHLNCIIAASQFIEFIFCYKLEASITKSCPPVWTWRLRQKTVRLKPQVVFFFFSPYANHSFQSTTTCTCTTSYHISASETFTCELVRRTWRQVVSDIFITKLNVLFWFLCLILFYFFLWNFTFYPEVRFWLLRFEQLDDETWCRHELSVITQAHASAEVSWWLVKHSLFSFPPP